MSEGGGERSLLAWTAAGRALAHVLGISKQLGHPAEGSEFCSEHLATVQAVQGQEHTVETLVSSGIVKPTNAADLAVCQAAASGTAWMVVGGKSSGGLLVRKGESTKSEEEVERLRYGAVVEELEAHGQRLRYRLLQGTGPSSGWVGTQFKGKEQLRKCRHGRVWIYCTGTRGDVQPFLALALGLQGLGYKVRFLGPQWSAEFEAIASGAVAFTDNGRDWKDFFMEQDESNAPPEEFFGMLAALRPAEMAEEEDFTGHMIGGWAFSELPATLARIDALLSSERPDVFIYNHLSPTVGRMMFCKYGVKSLMAHLGIEFHTIPTGRDPLNYNLWWRIDQLIVGPWTQYCPIADMSKEEFDLLYTSPERLIGAPSLYRQIMHGSSFPASAKDWVYSGWWVLSQDTQKKGDAAFGGSAALQKLEEFLGSGAEPVCMTFGSMPMPVACWSKLLSILTALKHRAIVISGWSGVSMENLREITETEEFQKGMELLPSEGMRRMYKRKMDEMVRHCEANVLFVDKAPHEWLFSRCRCNVHHGGAGTTAAALRAGVPSVIFPFMVEDQYYHAAWLNRLGAGVGLGVGSDPDPDVPSLMTPPWVERYLKNMNPLQDDVADALRKATSDESISVRAREVAEAIRAEDGVLNAADRIGKLLREEVFSGKVHDEWQAYQVEWYRKHQEQEAN